MSDPYERTLQLVFGIVGVLSTLITLAGLHYRDSLGCVLFRRVFLNHVRVTDPETDALTVRDTSSQPPAQCSQRTTLPRSYDLSTHLISENTPTALPSAHASTHTTQALIIADIDLDSLQLDNDATTAISRSAQK